MPHYHLPHNQVQNIKTVLEQMPAVQDFQNVAFIFQQLSDPTRLRIVWLLCRSEECVCNLASAVQVSNPAISHHLRSLKKCRLITSRRNGKEVYYALADTEEAKLLHQTVDAIFEMSCHSGQQ